MATVAWLKNNNEELNDENIEKEVVSEKKELKRIVEEVLDVELLKKEQRISVGDLKDEIHENSGLWEEFESELLDIYPDMDRLDLVECLNEIKKMRYFVGLNINSNLIRTILFRIKQKENNEKEKKNSKRIAEELRLDFLAESVDYFDESFVDFISKKNDFFGYLLYLQSCQDELDEKQKKILNQWFEEMIAWIKEWNALEIYEINIVWGKVTIKWLFNGKHVTIIYDLKSGKFEAVADIDLESLKNIEKEIEEGV